MPGCARGAFPFLDNPPAARAMIPLCRPGWRIQPHQEAARRVIKTPPQLRRGDSSGFALVYTWMLRHYLSECTWHRPTALQALATTRQAQAHATEFPPSAPSASPNFRVQHDDMPSRALVVREPQLACGTQHNRPQPGTKADSSQHDTHPQFTTLKYLVKLLQYSSAELCRQCSNYEQEI